MQQEPPALGAIVSLHLVGVRVKFPVAVPNLNRASEPGIGYGFYVREDRYGQIVAAVPTADGHLSLHILEANGQLHVRSTGDRGAKHLRLLPADFVVPGVPA